MTSQISWLFMLKLIPSVVSARKASWTWCSWTNAETNPDQIFIITNLPSQCKWQPAMAIHCIPSLSPSPWFSGFRAERWHPCSWGRSPRCCVSWPACRWRWAAPGCSTSQTLRSSLSLVSTERKSNGLPLKQGQPVYLCSHLNPGSSLEGLSRATLHGNPLKKQTRGKNSPNSKGKLH